VLWTLQAERADGVVDGDNDDEEDVWWSCTVEAETLYGVDNRPAHRLRYDPSEELGFDEETRDVVFLGATGNVLDLDNGALMPWRLEDEEGSDEEGSPVLLEAGVLQPGTAVKANYQGGDKAFAGQVYAVRYDSSDDGSPPRVVYDILYDDRAEGGRVLEEGVPADLVQPTGAPVRPLDEPDLDVRSGSFDAFFGAFVSQLTAGRLFKSLPADKQATFAECVQRSRPHFERELNALIAERGHGTVLSADDVREVILPRVMPRVKQEFQAAARA
jgi:hypothetical protein